MDAKELYFRPETTAKGKVVEYGTSRRPKQPSVVTSACIFCLRTRSSGAILPQEFMHGIGKGATLKKLMAESRFRELASVFSRSQAEKKDAIEARERALLHLYNAAVSAESLDDLRYTRFYQKVATGNASLRPENLPPTSAAASFLSLCVMESLGVIT